MTTKAPAKRKVTPCSRRCRLRATNEEGWAYVLWSDGSYAVKLAIGVWIDANLDELEWL